MATRIARSAVELVHYPVAVEVAPLGMAVRRARIVQARIPVEFVRDAIAVHGTLRTGASDPKQPTRYPEGTAPMPSLPHSPAADRNKEPIESLRARDSCWGIRELNDVVAEAHRAGLSLVQRHSMPANNLLLVFTPS